MAVTKNTENNKDEDEGKLEALSIAGGNVNDVTSVKMLRQFLNYLNIELLYDWHFHFWVNNVTGSRDWNRYRHSVHSSIFTTAKDEGLSEFT